MINPIDFILHIDKYLGILIENYGPGVYIILFAIIFLETGLVITPFLPGDSLLFVAGALSAAGFFNIALLFVLLSIAAIVGDSVNYWIGKSLGEKVFSKNRFFKKEYLTRTQAFYEKYGGKTIILARFVPIIRTFAPFVAGVGKMHYPRFLLFNIVGGIAWVGIFLFGGYFFGEIPIIKENLSIVIVLIILASLIPILIEYLRHRRAKKS